MSQYGDIDHTAFYRAVGYPQSPTSVSFTLASPTYIACRTMLGSSIDSVCYMDIVEAGNFYNCQ
jgi:hypothetical protein